MLSQFDKHSINAMIKAFPQLHRAGFNTQEILEGMACGANFEAIADVINELEFNSTVIIAFNWDAEQLWVLHTDLGLYSTHFDRILEKNHGKQRIELLSSLANLFKTLHLKPKAIQTILSARTAFHIIGELLRSGVHPTFVERRIARYFGSIKKLEKYIDIVLTLKLTKKMLRAIHEDIGFVELLNKEFNLSESNIHFLCLHSLSPSKIAAIKRSLNLLKNLMLSELELMTLLAHNEVEELLGLCHKFTEFNVPIETIKLFFKQKESIGDVLRKAFILLDTLKFPKEALTILEGNACRLYDLSFQLSLKKVDLDWMLSDVENGALKLLFIDIYFDFFISLPLSIENIMMIYRHENWQAIIHTLFVHAETLAQFTEFQIMQLICIPDLEETLKQLKEQLPGFLQSSFSTDFIIKVITQGPFNLPKLICPEMLPKVHSQHLINTAGETNTTSNEEQSTFIETTDKSPWLYGFWRPCSPEIQEVHPEPATEKCSVEEMELGSYIMMN